MVAKLVVDAQKDCSMAEVVLKLNEVIDAFSSPSLKVRPTRVSPSKAQLVGHLESMVQRLQSVPFALIYQDPDAKAIKDALTMLQDALHTYKKNLAAPATEN